MVCFCTCGIRVNYTVWLKALLCSFQASGGYPPSSGNGPGGGFSGNPPPVMMPGGYPVNLFSFCLSFNETCNCRCKDRFINFAFWSQGSRNTPFSLLIRQAPFSNVYTANEYMKYQISLISLFELRWKIWICGSCIVHERTTKDCTRSGPSNIILLSFFGSLMFAGLHSHSPLLTMTKGMPWLRRRHLKTKIDMDKKYTKIN